ncbi:peroxiredoxin-5, mitochondrial [Planococcus citri]|uniref:peroxiredoxin-5, mitochondrial n=1 Tax=Planococcus citri TaxID=170843 RepID=UPI0031F91375
MPIKVGDKIPSVELYENSPGNKVNILDICKEKKVVLFAVPGAFTPGCSKTHLPGYVKEADNLKEHGIGEIICVAVNDAFVLNAWGREQGTEGKVRLLSDPQATFTKAIELSTDIPPMGGTRSMRYSMLLDDGVIKALNVEPDGTGLSCSLASHMKVH